MNGNEREDALNPAQEEAGKADQDAARKAEQDAARKTEQDAALRAALEELHGFVAELAKRAGVSCEYAEELWQGIRRSAGLLQELAYYHDYGSFLSKYNVAGYTLTDALVWQVDHFKLYMDRPEDMNRYRQERLLLSAFDTMLQLEKDPEPLDRKMRGETGQDIQGGEIYS